jgi:hypothetical protein
LAIKVGQKLVSTVDTTAVITIRGSQDDIEIGCGGAPMVTPSGNGVEPTGAPQPSLQDGTVIGKRYADEESGIELLCTTGGQGTLTANGRPLILKATKPLPASD